MQEQTTPELSDQQTFQQYLRELARRAIRVVLEGVMCEGLDALSGVGWGERSLQQQRLPQWLLHARPRHLDRSDRGYPGATEQKAKNLHGNPHVILMTGCNTWDAGLDVVVEGDAVRIIDDDMLQRLASAWATKLDGRWQYEGRGGGLHHKHLSGGGF